MRMVSSPVRVSCRSPQLDAYVPTELFDHLWHPSKERNHEPAKGEESVRILPTRESPDLWGSQVFDGAVEVFNREPLTLRQMRKRVEVVADQCCCRSESLRGLISLGER